MKELLNVASMILLFFFVWFLIDPVNLGEHIRLVGLTVQGR